MRRRRRRGNYKFTEKTQSRRGIVSFLLAVLSLVVLVTVIVNSFQNRGAGSMYLGSAGVASLLVGIVAVVLAVGSLREENSFKLFPYLGTVCSFLATGIWVVLYAVGIVL